MFHSRFLSSHTAILAGLVVAGLLWATQPASAQQAPYASVSKFDRANAVAALPGAYYAPWHAPQPPAAMPVVRTPAVLTTSAGTLLVTVRSPVSSEPAYVTLRGPDGAVQRYALENGPASIQTRDVIVRQGDTATFHFVVAAPPK